MGRMTTKGQITIPKQVREALDLERGDTLHFRVHGDRAVVSKVPDFLDLAGSVEEPTSARTANWADVRERAWTSRFRDR